MESTNDLGNYTPTGRKDFVFKGIVLMSFIGIFVLSACICARNILRTNHVREIERLEMVVDSLENELNVSKSYMDSTIYLYNSKLDSILKNNENLVKRVNYLNRQVNEINAELDACD